MKQAAGLLSTLLTSLALGLSSPVNAYTISMIAPSMYNADTATMDIALGISNHAIEDFENTSLISNLSYTLDGGIAPITYTSLPAVFLQPSFQDWDGGGMLINTQGNACPGFPVGCFVPIANRLTFNIQGGTPSLGVGLTSFQSTSPSSSSFPITNHVLYINGTPVPGTLESLAGSNWAPSAFGRNGYLIVTQNPGDAPITSLGFGNIAGNDILVFDHLAVAAVPLPPAAYLFGTGLLGLIGFAKRARPDANS